MDVQTSFLNRNIKSEVYVYYPDIPLNKVCLLKKALYRLKESPRNRFACFHYFITRIHFRRSKYDYCILLLLYENEKKKTF